LSSTHQRDHGPDDSSDLDGRGRRPVRYVDERQPAISTEGRQASHRRRPRRTKSGFRRQRLRSRSRGQSKNDGSASSDERIGSEHPGDRGNPKRSYAEMWAGTPPRCTATPAAQQASQVTPFTRTDADHQIEGLVSQSVPPRPVRRPMPGGTDLDTDQSSGPQVISGMTKAIAEAWRSRPALTRASRRQLVAVPRHRTSIMNNSERRSKLASMHMSMMSSCSPTAVRTTSNLPPPPPPGRGERTARDGRSTNAVGITPVQAAMGSAGSAPSARAIPSLSAVGRPHLGRRADGAVSWTGGRPTMTAAGKARHVGWNHRTSLGRPAGR